MKIYFASDQHFGAPTREKSLIREKRFVNWLDEIQSDATALFLLGDLFDFWFEYKKVVPKGFVRILGKLAELSDSEINIHIFTGNHDLWMREYLTKEVGVEVHNNSSIISEQNKKLFIGHGDGLGDGDYFYKFLKRIFTSKICSWAFARLHPNFAFSIAHRWSESSRKSGGANYISNEKELLLGYCQDQQELNPVDYYIFGHRHLPLALKVDEKAKYINLGDWLYHYTYAVFEDGEVKLKTYKK